MGSCVGCGHEHGLVDGTCQECLLLEQITRRKEDGTFMARLREMTERHREVLDRLKANGD